MFTVLVVQRAQEKKAQQALADKINAGLASLDRGEGIPGDLVFDHLLEKIKKRRQQRAV